MVERAFEETEIFEVIKDFNGDKLLGPDGFPMAFLGDSQAKSYGCVSPYFFAQVQFVKSLNATFITRIPKKTTTVEVRDCQPISLVGGCIKL